MDPSPQTEIRVVVYHHAEADEVEVEWATTDGATGAATCSYPPGERAADVLAAILRPSRRFVTPSSAPPGGDETPPPSSAAEPWALGKDPALLTPEDVHRYAPMFGASDADFLATAERVYRRRTARLAAEARVDPTFELDGGAMTLARAADIHRNRPAHPPSAVAAAERCLVEAVERWGFPDVASAGCYLGA